MEQYKIDRINELARKNKAEGLTPRSLPSVTFCAGSTLTNTKPAFAQPLITLSMLMKNSKKPDEISSGFLQLYFCLRQKRYYDIKS